MISQQQINFDEPTKLNKDLVTDQLKNIYEFTSFYDGLIVINVAFLNYFIPIKIRVIDLY